MIRRTITAVVCGACLRGLRRDDQPRHGSAIEGMHVHTSDFTDPMTEPAGASARAAWPEVESHEA